MSRRHQAFTLPELLVYCAVLALFLTGVYASLSLSQRSFQVTQAEADAVDAALTANNQITRMLATAAGNTIATQGTGGLPGFNVFTLTGSPRAVAFVSAQPAGVTYTSDNSGDTLWQKWVCFYIDSSNTLKRAEAPINATSSPAGTNTTFTTANTTAVLPTLSSSSGGTLPATEGGGTVSIFTVTKNLEGLSFPVSPSVDAPVAVSGSGAPQFAWRIASAVTASTAQLTVGAGVYKVVLVGHFTPRQ